VYRAKKRHNSRIHFYGRKVVLRILFVSLFVVLVDQVSKLAVRFYLEYGRPYPVVGDFFKLTYIENPGMAFGIQFGGQVFFTTFAALATVVIVVYIFRVRSERFLLRFALALILGGAIGNLIDRLLYGKVVDFLEFGVSGLRWPIFNLADSAVSIGMILLIFLILFDRSLKESNDEKLSTEEEVFS
jgi:signal peptidase II